MSAGEEEKTKDEINVPIALSAFRDGDQGPSKVTKTAKRKTTPHTVFIWWGEREATLQCFLSAGEEEATPHHVLSGGAG